MGARIDRAELVAARVASGGLFRRAPGVTDAQLATRGKTRCRSCGRVVKLAGLSEHRRQMHGDAS